MKNKYHELRPKGYLILHDSLGWKRTEFSNMILIMKWLSDMILRFVSILKRVKDSLLSQVSKHFVWGQLMFLVFAIIKCA